MTLTEFLLARIAEDEEIASRNTGTAYEVWTYVPHEDRLGGKTYPAIADDWNGTRYIPISEHICRHDPRRVLAECAAKRRIVAFAVQFRMSAEQETDPIRKLIGEAMAEDANDAVVSLAMVYADHPDYRQEWSA